MNPGDAVPDARATQRPNGSVGLGRGRNQVKDVSAPRLTGFVALPGDHFGIVGRVVGQEGGGIGVKAVGQQAGRGERQKAARAANPDQAGGVLEEPVLGFVEQPVGEARHVHRIEMAPPAPGALLRLCSRASVPGRERAHVFVPQTRSFEQRPERLPSRRRGGAGSAAAAARPEARRLRAGASGGRRGRGSERRRRTGAAHTRSIRAADGRRAPSRDGLEGRSAAVTQPRLSSHEGLTPEAA